ncbi:MAG: hypothetical protein ACJ71I_06400 [Nitrososphaeraceae archaeon]
MNLRVSEIKDSKITRNRVMSYVLRPKHCDLYFHAIGNPAASDTGEFSLNRKFILDKYNSRKNLGLYNVFSWVNGGE